MPNKQYDKKIYFVDRFFTHNFNIQEYDCRETPKYYFAQWLCGEIRIKKSTMLRYVTKDRIYGEWYLSKEDAIKRLKELYDYEIAYCKATIERCAERIEYLSRQQMEHLGD